MVANTIRPLANAIAEFILETSNKTVGKPPIAFVKMCEVSPEILALITGKHIINTITQYKPLTATSISLGGRVETEVSLKNFKFLNPLVPLDHATTILFNGAESVRPPPYIRLIF